MIYPDYSIDYDCEYPFMLSKYSGCGCSYNAQFQCESLAEAFWLLKNILMIEDNKHMCTVMFPSGKIHTIGR